MSEYMLKKLQEMYAQEQHAKEKEKENILIEFMKSSTTLEERKAKFRELRDQFLKEAKELMAELEADMEKFERYLSTSNTLSKLYRVLWKNFTGDINTVILVLQKKDPKTITVAKTYLLFESKGEILVKYGNEKEA